MSIVGSPPSAPSDDGLLEGVDARAGERAASDLDDEPVERDAGGDELPADRLAALDGEPVQVALAGERQRAGRQRLVEGVDGRVAGNARMPRAGRDVCAERGEPLEHDRVGVDRDEDAQGPAAGRGDDGGRERGVPAARDRELSPVVRVGEAEPFDDLEPDQDAEQVAGLVGAGHVLRLVLHPDAAARGEAEAVAERVRPGERRGDEAVAVDAGHAAIELEDEVAELSVRKALVRSVEKRPVADERVRLLVVEREADGGGVELAAEDVVGVVAAGLRAAERVRIARRRRRSAASADEPCRRPDRRAGAHRSSSTPVRALNSSISSSQPAASACCSRQNVGSRRAWKSSIVTPCCSTQVK